MFKVLLVSLAMLVSGSSFAGNNVIVPPITRWANVVPAPTKRPDNFGHNTNDKIDYTLKKILRKGK